jgi:hypothetical protein
VDRVTLAALRWRRDTLTRLRDQLRTTGRHQATVAEALALLGAEPDSTVEALLLDLTTKEDTTR